MMQRLTNSNKVKIVSLDARRARSGRGMREPREYGRSLIAHKKPEIFSD